MITFTIGLSVRPENNATLQSVRYSLVSHLQFAKLIFLLFIASYTKSIRMRSDAAISGSNNKMSFDAI